jgi:hypothetical protein
VSRESIKPDRGLSGTERVKRTAKLLRANVARLSMRPDTHVTNYEHHRSPFISGSSDPVPFLPEAGERSRRVVRTVSRRVGVYLPPPPDRAGRRPTRYQYLVHFDGILASVEWDYPEESPEMEQEK